jgi:branched-chain amino acid aminotransferase
VTVASATVRRAAPADAAKIAAAVAALLRELGGKPADERALAAEARALAEDERAGALLVAEADGEIVGFLGLSWQRAVRIPGRYGLIQELWVHPDWRSRQVGAELLSALADLARSEGVGRIEVGLPGERFPALAATASFYEANGFAAVGLRMRLTVGSDASDGR